jgi:hypothetical protein
VKQFKYVIGISAVLLFLAGCYVTTIHPLFQEKELIKMPELAGTWSHKTSTTGTTFEFWKFEEVDSNYSYNLSIWNVDSSDIRQNDTAKFEIRLGKLGKINFFDMFPIDYDKGINDYLKMQLLPSHFISKIKIENDSLNLSFLNNEWFKDMVKKKKIKIKYEIQEKSDRIIVTASTTELQKFVTKYAADTSAFPMKGNAMGRVK